jgi:hypothetical protein
VVARVAYIVLLRTIITGSDRGDFRDRTAGVIDIAALVGAAICIVGHAVAVFVVVAGIPNRVLR